MEAVFHKMLIDALTDAIEKKTTVTIKSNINSFIIVITATENEIIISVSKMSNLVDDVILAVSEALGRKPDMVYNRVNAIREDFIVNYILWLNDDERGRSFIEKEFKLPQNNITYLSPKAIEIIQEIQH